MAKNSFLDWSTTAGDNTDIGGIGILGSNNVNNFDNAMREQMAQSRSGLDGKVVYATKSGNYTAVANDNNAVHIYTATATITLTAAATLAANWHYTVVANGAAVTIDPNGSETINGATTLIVPNGSSATIICDGSNFFTVVKPQLWVPVGQGIYTGSAAASLVLTDLGAFKMLRFGGLIFTSTAAAVYARTSSNNGSSWNQGASDYLTQYTQSAGVGITAALVTSNITALTTNNTCASVNLSGYEISNFNVAGQPMRLRGQSGIDTGSLITAEIFNYSVQTAARNALQFFSGSGTITYSLRIEGVIG